MRKINGKLFLCLLIGVVVFSGAAFALHRFQHGRIANALLWQARRAEENGDAKKNAQFLQRYLEFKPRDLDEMTTLAKLWVGDGTSGPVRNRYRGMKLLDEVLTYRDDREMRKLLVKTAMSLRDFTLAREHLTKLLPPEQVSDYLAALRDEQAKKAPMPERMTKKDRERGELEAYWGRLFEVEKMQPDAMDCYRLAIRHAPEEQTGYVRLAYLLRRQPATGKARDDSDSEADRVIDDLVAANDSSADAYLVRWRYRREFDLLGVRESGTKGRLELETCGEDVSQAVRRKPDSVDVLLCAADLERLRGRAAAEDPLRSPEQRLAGLRAHRQKAHEYLRRGLEKVEKDRDRSVSPEESGEFQLLWHQANLILDDLAPNEPEKLAARKDEITQVIDQMRKTRVAGAADYLLARVSLLESDWATAAGLFERARTQLRQPDLACQADLFLGQCYARLQEHTQMFNAYKRVAEFDPSSVIAHLGMAEARAAQNKLGDAAKQFDVLAAHRRMPARGWLDYARLELQRQLLSDRPDWPRVEAVLTRATEANPKAVVEVTLLRAEVLLRQDRGPDALKEVTAARDRTPDEADLWVAVADVCIRLKKPADARKALDDAKARVGDHVSLRLARARLLAADGQLAPASVDQLAENRSSLGETDQARLLGGLADHCLRAGHLASARKLWEGLAALPRFQKDLRLQLLLFDLALRQDDRAGMTRRLEEVRKIEQAGGTYHRYGTALLTIWEARSKGTDERKKLLDQARQGLAAVQQARPGWGSLFLARAEVAELEGDHEQAIKDLEAAVGNGEGGPNVLRKLLDLYRLKDRNRDAEALIKRLDKAVLKSKELSRMAVHFSLRQGDIGKALEVARATVRDDTRDPRELVYIARVLGAAKKFDEAEKKLGEALVAGPTVPEVHLGRVQFLIERKRKDEALKAIRDAEEALPEGKKSLTLARCYDVAHQPRKAHRYYTLALEEHKDDAAVLRTVAEAHLAAGRVRDAEPLLRKLKSGTLPRATAADLSWAQRNLAMVLAGSPDYQRFADALDLVGLKLDVNGRLAEVEHRGQPTETVRARARVLASQTQKQFRTQAIRLFEALDNRGELTPDDRFVLAMLYEADGRTDRSQARLRELTAMPLRTPRYLAQYALSLLATKRTPTALDEVERIVKQLEELERLREVGPNGYASVEMQARLLEARGKPDDAVRVMQKHVTRAGAQPEEVLLLIGTLSRQKKFGEAFDLCEKTWDRGECNKEALGAVSTSLLRVMKPTDAQVAIVERRLERAVADGYKGAVLRMQLADLQDRRGEHRKAAEQWRAVLTRDPNNFVAMNNLAWQIVTHGGDAKEALTHIERALGGMGRRADLLDTRGLVHLKLKDPARALADFKDAVQDGPTPTRLLHLAQAQHLSRDRDGARETLKKAKEQGLEVSKLHPVEQGTARELLAAYGL